MDNLRQRVFKGMSANVITQGTALIIQFCLIPVFLKFWGVQLYGQWILLYSVPSYLSFIDLGFGMTSSSLIAKSLHKNDLKDAQKIFQSTLYITFSVGLILTLISFIISQIFSISSILRITSFSSMEVSGTFLVLVFYVVINQQLGIFSGIYNYNNRYHYISNLNSGGRLLEFLGIIVTIMLTKSILFVAVVMLALKIVYVLFVIYDSLKHSPWMKISFKNKDSTYIKSQLTPSLSLLLYPISFAILNQGISILIGRTLGNFNLVLYNTVRTFVNSIKTFASQINNLLFAEMIKFFAAAEILAAKKFYNKTIAFTTVFILCSGTLLILFGPAFISVWTNGKLHDISSVLILFFILETATYNLWHANYQTYLAQNRHTKLTLFFFISSLLIIILTSLFIKKSGMSFFLIISAFFNLALYLFTKRKIFI